MKIFGYDLSFRRVDKRSYTEPLQMLFGSYTSGTKDMQLSTVYRCVDLISNTVAQMDFRLLNTTVHPVPEMNNPLYNILCKTPNKYMTRFMFMKTIVMEMLLKGNSYIYINRDQRGNVIDLVILDNSKMVVQTMLDKVSYIYNGSTLDNDNVVHIRNISYDGIIGVSTIQAAHLTLDSATASEVHSNNFFAKGANLSGVLSTSANLKDEQKDQILKSWQANYGGSNGGGVAILSGNMEYKPISVNPRDAQLLETRQYNVIEICRFFGVSPIMAFDLTNSSYKNAESSSLSFLQETIQPILEKIELEFWKAVLKPSEKEKYDIRFNTDDYLKIDKASLASYYSQLFQMGALTTNEVREKLGMPKVEDGDTIYIQANVVPSDYFYNNKKGVL